MRNVVILGSSGSIGERALRVIEALPSRLRVVGLAVNRDSRKVLEQAARFGVRDIAVGDPAQARQCAAEAPAGVRVRGGPRGVEELAGLEGADVVLCAVVGVAGLRPVMAAVTRGTDVALATKEVLVAAGALVTRACSAHGARLLPVDSEHSAVLQCLEGAGRTRQEAPAAPGSGNTPFGAVKRLLLTASGGPFARQHDVDLDTVTVDEALNHPTWDMGRKVTVDSATLMNKGLEIMEAHWLFGLPVDRIDVVIHPESIVHSLVELIDGSMLAQLGLPDMRYAIQYALTYPDRVDGGLPALDLAAGKALHFFDPELERFPCLSLARTSARAGGTMPAVLNAANEVAVHKFLSRQIAFSGIWRLVEAVMDKHSVIPEPTLEEVIQTDAWARRTAEEI
jgi:1-deoxy-D-xylulose-5-phosphate reductoisomerase